MDQKVQYIVDLVTQGNTAAAVQELQRLQGQGDKTNESLRQLGEQARTAIAAIGATVAIKAAIDKYVEYETGVSKLNAVLKAGGQYTADYSDQLQALAKSYADTTRFSKEAVLSAETLLLSFGATKQQLPEVTKAVLNLAALMGTDATTAAMEFGRALNGQFTMLTRLGFTIDANAGRSERFASVMAQANQRAGGAATAFAQTDAGKLNQFQKSVDELSETFGKLALEGLLPSINNLKALADETTKWLSTSPQAKGYVSELVAIGSQTAALVVGVKALEMAWRFSIGAAISQAGGLSAALSAIPKSIQIAITAEAALKIVQAIQAGGAMLKAEGQEQQSSADLAAQNLSRRSAILAQLRQQEASGQRSSISAQLIREELEKAFTGTTKTTLTAGPGTYGASLTPVTTSERDTAAESAALSKAFETLNPQFAKSTAANSAAGTAAVTKEAADALKELEKLDREAQVAQLDGIEKERAAAKAEYDAKVEQITNLARKGDLGEARKNESIIAQRQVLDAKLSALDDKADEDAIKRAEEVAKAKAKLLEESLTGLAKERQMVEDRYALQRQEILDNQKLSPSEANTLLGMADESHAQGIKGLDKYRPTDDLKVFEDQLTAAAIGDSETRVERAEFEFQRRKEYYQQLLKQGKIMEGGLTQLLADAGKQRDAILQGAYQQGKVESEQLQQHEAGLWAQNTAELTRQFQVRRENLIAYYDLEIQRASGNATLIAALEQKKTADLKQLLTEQTSQTNTFAQQTGITFESMSREMSTLSTNAFMAFVQGKESASQAVQQFFSDFLMWIGQAILQALVFRAVMSMFGAFSGAGAGGGASSVQGGMTGWAPLAKASGGFAIPIAAADGVPGVSSVSAPTYFPRFNVLAGEAGREVMTVLARPRMMNIGGVNAMVGGAGGDTLAITRAGDLGGSRGSGNGSGGLLVIQVDLGADLEARITQNSISGAEVRINTNLTTNTPTAAAVKRLVS